MVVIHKDKCLKWLEKQGRANKVSIWKHWKDGIAGNGEGKPIYLIKDGDTYKISSCLGFECDYIELSELDNLMLEKKEEQKPILDFKASNWYVSKVDGKIHDLTHNPTDKVEPKFNAGQWSEEDEDYYDAIIAKLEVTQDDAGLTDNQMEFLKSIKQRIGG